MPHALIWDSYTILETKAFRKTYIVQCHISRKPLITSAGKGNNEAEMNVGICYAAGKGVKQDYTLAYTWWKKAAEQGHTKTMVNLATCYEMGVGVNRDLSEAYHWYLEASKHGDQFAAQKLSYYEQGNL